MGRGGKESMIAVSGSSALHSISSRIGMEVTDLAGVGFRHFSDPFEHAVWVLKINTDWLDRDR